MFIVFDIGGTKTRIASSYDGNEISVPIIYATPQNFHEAMRVFSRAINTLTKGSPVTMAAGGVAGPLDKDKTQILGGPNIQDWWEKPLRKRLQDAVRAPVFIENDAAMGGLGEAVYGAGIGHTIVAYLTVSTGVGGSRIVNRRIDTSSLGFEPGKMIIDAGNTLCVGCSKIGVLEDYVSGSGIKKKYKKEAHDIKNQYFWDEKSELLAFGVHNISVLWSPDIIVIGGALMKQPGMNIDIIRKKLDETLTIFAKPPLVELSKNGDLVGLYGGLAYANYRAIS